MRKTLNTILLLCIFLVSGATLLAHDKQPGRRQKPASTPVNANIGSVADANEKGTVGGGRRGGILTTGKKYAGQTTDTGNPLFNGKVTISEDTDIKGSEGRQRAILTISSGSGNTAATLVVQLNGNIRNERTGGTWRVVGATGAAEGTRGMGKYIGTRSDTSLVLTLRGVTGAGGR